MSSRKRQYHQFCGLARALDVVGERWTLLLVRNLLLGPRRYSDLLEELPGITTNLLAARLQQLEKEGLLERRVLPPPTPATVYALTVAGAQLEPAIMELARWGGRYLSAPAKADRVDVGWGMLSLKRRYKGGARLVAHLVLPRRTYELTMEADYLRVRDRATRTPDVTVRLDEHAWRAWLFGGVDGHALAAQGKLQVEGAAAAFETLCAAFLPAQAPPRWDPETSTTVAV